MAGLTRLVVIDDDRLVEEGLALVLARQGFEVIAVERDIEAGVRSIVGHRPDVILCDVMLRGEPRGLDLTARLSDTTAAGTPVVLLSSYAPAYFVDQAKRSGAAGYLTKDADPAELAAAIEGVAGGGTAFPPESFAERQPTPRELDVLRLAANGRTNSEIGGDLGISPRTVEAHLDRMFERYGVSDRISLSRLALRKGWIVELPTDRG